MMALAIELASRGRHFRNADSQTDKEQSPNSRLTTGQAVFIRCPVEYI